MIENKCLLMTVAVAVMAVSPDMLEEPLPQISLAKLLGELFF